MEGPDLNFVEVAVHSARKEFAQLFGGVCVCVNFVSVGDFATEIRAYLLEGGKQLAQQI